ncbi:hypothetical protein BJP34_08290 [Moorena producens PAL-8-15-08-1]|uniref:Uncharacterized protein n=1 Tax=Moorena producens PAL-8-15-08-1 TaxID=1458985 RepID=A0A1D8TPC2_9CYAN|nr:hypothetical protein BJP34_08290 [Moorena producens PAL-8-15-08-1]
MVRLIFSEVETISMVSFGGLLGIKRRLSKPFLSMDCALISRKIFKGDQSHGSECAEVGNSLSAWLIQVMVPSSSYYLHPLQALGVSETEIPAGF